MTRSTLLVLAVAVILAGCAKQGNWVYKPNAYDKPNATCGESVAVLPFSDSRPQVSDNKIMLFMVPLIPYGWANMTQPLASRMQTSFDPKEDFAKALAEELSNTQRFKESYFSHKSGNADIVCTGDVLDTTYYTEMYSYGLRFMGSLFWYLGIPAQKVQNNLSVYLQCHVPATGDVITEGVYTAEPVKQINNLYSRKNNFHYPTMLRNQ